MITLGLPCSHYFGIPETMIDVASSAQQTKARSQRARQILCKSVLTLAALVTFLHLAREMAILGTIERYMLTDGTFAGFKFNYTTRWKPSFKQQLAENLHETPLGSGKLHFCTTPYVNGKNTSSPSGLKIQYQCGGEAYDDFCVRLDSFTSNTKRHGTTWGRRPYPLASGTTVLVFGNSHTRQVVYEWFCQYQQAIDNVEEYTPEVIVVRFDNNSTLISVTNSPVVYSRMWPLLLEKTLGRPFQSLDAIVLGKFNDMKDSANTKFMATMTNLTSGVDGADFKSIAPPKLADVAKVYSGPIVCVGMFAKYATRATELFYSTKKNLETSGNRTNIRVIDGRKYIPTLGECGNDNRSDVPGEVGACNEGEVPGMRHASNMHRCTGPCGGHPDLIAWDIMEESWQLMASSTR